MLIFAMKTEDRKKLIGRLAELTGCEPVYLNPPTYAFEIGDYNVAKDGTLSVTDYKADLRILMILMGEGYIEEKPVMSPYGNVYPVSADIRVSLSGHDGRSVRNLMNMIRSRYVLINHACGSDFYISGKIAELLADEWNITSVDVIRKTIRDRLKEYPEDIRGIELRSTEIRFTGFEKYTDIVTHDAWKCMAEMMAVQAKEQYRILARKTETDNERYTFRIFLIRLGMKGNRYKQTRKILLRNLPGYSAFRTEEERARALRKAKMKRLESKNSQ